MVGIVTVKVSCITIAYVLCIECVSVYALVQFPLFFTFVIDIGHKHLELPNARIQYKDTQKVKVKTTVKLLHVSVHQTQNKASTLKI